ncbi:MAG: hypothetical protein GEU99_24255 [Luteitalea sp.]|nr:hypothetical protein [Luteitalea sp.]
MSTNRAPFDHLSDADLLREVPRLAACERHATASLIASLAVLDTRQLYLGEGFSSLFGYCCECLHLSEAAAYDRITAARAARRFPVILEHLTEGTVTLTAIRLLAPHLTEENHAGLLAKAQYRTKREVEELLAQLHPQPDVPASVRKLPAPAPPRDVSLSTTAARADAPPERTTLQSEARSPTTLPTETLRVPLAAGPPPRRAEVAPLAPARYKVSFTIDAETYAKLREAQDLLRHAIPDGDPAAIYDRALTALLAQLAKTKHAATERPRWSDGPVPGSRRIPAEVQRAVWARDGGQCTFVSPSGRRCAQRGFLEYHHAMPFALGGEASVENVCLRCKPHNTYQAARDFGPWDRRHVQDRGRAARSQHDGTRASTSSQTNHERRRAHPACEDEPRLRR